MNIHHNVTETLRRKAEVKRNRVAFLQYCGRLIVLTHPENITFEPGFEG